MKFNKYQKLKSMQSFKQKFYNMTKEYRDGFWNDYKLELDNLYNEKKLLSTLKK